MTPSFSRATPSIERVEPGKVRTGDGDADLTEIMISTSDTSPGKRITQNLDIVDAVIVLKQTASPNQSSSLRDQAIVTDSAFSRNLNEAKMETIERSRHKAGLLDANGVCAVRIESSQLSRAEMSVSAYGTAAIALSKTVMRG